MERKRGDEPGRPAGDEFVREVLGRARMEDSEITRRRLLAGLGGTAGAGTALAGLPAVAGAHATIAKRKGAGLPKAGANSIELLAQINQNGPNLQALGYATRIAGLTDGQLFTQPRGVKFDDPNSATPSTARFTLFSNATISALSTTDNVITVVAGGDLALYFLENGGASFSSPNSFAAGKLIATYDGTFQDNLVTRPPTPGTGNQSEATVYLTGNLIQRSASRFSVGGKRTTVGQRGFDLRLEAVGNGELLEPQTPISRIFVVGSLEALE
jgi:hypothetical protein